MNEKPLVTVYIPTYNRLELLTRAVKSVLDQDYPNIELIVVDDGSSDGTVEYLHSLVQVDERVRCFINEINSGACVSRNKAIWAANGDFITGLDDDDYFLPSRIRSFVFFWSRKRTESIALYSDAVVHTANGGKKSTRRPKLIARQDLVDKNYIGNQVFTRVKSLRDIGGFDVSLPILQDLDAWYRLLGEGCLAQRVPLTTYVVDKSHPHERVGVKNREKINFAIQKLSKRYELTGLEISCFKLGILSEENLVKRKFYRVQRLITRPNLRTLWNFIAH